MAKTLRSIIGGKRDVMNTVMTRGFGGPKEKIVDINAMDLTKVNVSVERPYRTKKRLLRDNRDHKEVAIIFTYSLAEGMVEKQRATG